MLPDRDTLLTLTDEALLGHCRSDCFRASGPGGQHRNTTDSAVRLTLTEAGISAASADHRSQHRNRTCALARLRTEIALSLRAIPPQPWTGPVKLGRKDHRYPAFVAAILDHLEAHNYAVGDAARALGLSTGRLIRTLAADPPLWTKVNQERQRRALHPLKAP